MDDFLVLPPEVNDDGPVVDAPVGAPAHGLVRNQIVQFFAERMHFDVLHE